MPESQRRKARESFVNAYEDEDFVGTVTQVALERTRADDGNNIFLTEIELELQGRRLRWSAVEHRNRDRRPARCQVRVSSGAHHSS